MKKKILASLLLSTVMVSQVAVLTTAHAETTDDKIAAQDNKISNLTAQQQEAQKQVDQIQEQVSAIQTEQSNLQSENDRLQAESKKLEGEQLEKVASVKKSLNIETFVSLSCTHCPEVVQALNLISVNNENITTSMVDSAVFFEEAKEKDIQAVPVVFINGKVSSVGEQTLEQLITTITNA